MPSRQANSRPRSRLRRQATKWTVAQQLKRQPLPSQHQVASLTIGRNAESNPKQHLLAVRQTPVHPAFRSAVVHRTAATRPSESPPKESFNLSVSVLAARQEPHHRNRRHQHPIEIRQDASRQDIGHRDVARSQDSASTPRLAPIHILRELSLPNITTTQRNPC